LVEPSQASVQTTPRGRLTANGVQSVPHASAAQHRTFASDPRWLTAWQSLSAACSELLAEPARPEDASDPACPPWPAVTIDDIGELRPRGEFWILTYADCQHEQWFMRGPMNYATAVVQREVRTYYATCDTCACPLVDRQSSLAKTSSSAIRARNGCHRGAAGAKRRTRRSRVDSRDE
jgi:hypothetical protein